MPEIRAPGAGESITEVVIEQLIKKEGDYVEIDDELAVFETEKATQSIYAEEAGYVSWTVSEGDTVAVDTVIGAITAGKAPEKAPLKPEATNKEVQPEKLEQPKTEPAPSGTNARISPEVFLQELDKKEEVKTAPAQPQQSPGIKFEVPKSDKEERRKMSKMRKVIAERLVAAKNHTAMLTTFNEIDMSAVKAIRAKKQEEFVKKHGIKLGFMSFFVKAAVHALQQIQDINSFIDGDEIVNPNSYDISVAVGTDKGLFVPVIRNADTLSFAEIEGKIKEYAVKANEGKITVDDMKGGSFTITNGGTFGSLLSTPIINPPQSGILGMHGIVDRPVAVDDNIEIRPMMYVALSYDHRIVDGKEAVTFLVLLKKVLEAPEGFFLDL